MMDLIALAGLVWFIRMIITWPGGWRECFDFEGEEDK